MRPTLLVRLRTRIRGIGAVATDAASAIVGPAGPVTAASHHAVRVFGRHRVATRAAETPAAPVRTADVESVGGSAIAAGGRIELGCTGYRACAACAACTARTACAACTTCTGCTGCAACTACAFGTTSATRRSAGTKRRLATGRTCAPLGTRNRHRGRGACREQDADTKPGHGPDHHRSKLVEIMVVTIHECCPPH